MAREIEATPEIIAQQAAALAQPLDAFLLRLRRRPPGMVVTCARGSSAHAATFAKHLIERYLGLPVAEAAPSIASVYQRRLHLCGQLVLAISQSGNSDDLIVFASHARGAGALTVAVTNDPASPLAAACEFILPIAAGPERSVAATKSFVATAATLLRLVGAWAEDSALLNGASQLPDRLARASRLDWSRAAEALCKTTHWLPSAEAQHCDCPGGRVKLKETCNLHTEAFSGAEFLHGPIGWCARTIRFWYLHRPTKRPRACASFAAISTQWGQPDDRGRDPVGGIVLQYSASNLKPMRLPHQSFYLMLVALVTGSGSTSTSRLIFKDHPNDMSARISTLSQPIASSMEALFIGTRGAYRGERILVGPRRRCRSMSRSTSCRRAAG
jgi:fructoselysine-6-P-deglycase FrlB-like protein